jgi:2-polyprenyl-3-methyl-5-hydroxy-6-metoxy-1,4-benzoquinol methylase
MPNLEQRSLEPELMDDPALDPLEHARALRGLARIHALTFTPGRLWKAIESRIAEQGSGSELSLLDVGCSDGWLACSVAKVARRRGWNVRLIGCDFSQRALELFADRARHEGFQAELEPVDILQQELPTRADVVLNSLFLHHFSGEQVCLILPKLAAAARRLLIVDDLLRTPLGYWYCQLGVHLLTRSRVVQVDGPLSVRAAFSLAEIRDLVQVSGLTDATIRTHWPERYLIDWSPPSTTWSS